MSIVKIGLLYFDQAVRDGSIRKAAENLRVASSAVNRQLLQLEQEFGVALFERLPRGIRPTAAGEALLGYVRQWNRDSTRLRQEIERLKGGVRGTIHVAAAESITEEVLPLAMARLQAHHALVDFTLISGDNFMIKTALLAKDADVVCAFDVVGSPRVETLLTVRSRFGVISPPDHPLAKLTEVSLSQCLAYPLIAPTDDWLKHSNLREVIGDSRMPFQIAARVERIGMLKNLVQAGLGFAFLAPIGISSELREGRLAWTPLAKTVAWSTTISLLAPKGRVRAPYLRAFLEILREELGKLQQD